ncbi:MAG: cyclic pyranopterin monophosphate synthase MoaC [Oscillospiraceae bacterium]|nr:cyclic pyranopterin monophosphate synthase MoaC [Oscillospiraceae bacterium]
MTDFTHFNEQGRARMVDVSEKQPTLRTATAAGTVLMRPQTAEAIRTGGVPKGDVLAVAQVAGIMAAKRTSEIVPMCHPLALAGVDVRFALGTDRVDIEATVRCKGETGVEMEALHAVAAAALTVYDMCKALQKDMTITGVRLLEKTGGKSGRYSAMAKVLAVCVSERKGEKKHPVDEIALRLNHGIVGDAHAGDWHRQVSLLANESVDKMREKGLALEPGDFAENILTEGITLRTLPVGTRLRVGEALLEVTQIGKECHSDCEIKKKVGVCVMPAEGIFAVVKKEGVVRAGDEIAIEEARP